MLVVQPIAARSHCRSNGGAAFNEPDANTLEILQQPVVVERHRADDVGRCPERNDADPVVRPAFNEISRYFPDSVEACDTITADCEILRQHGIRNVEDEHDVDTAGFDFRLALTELRSGETDDESGERQQEKGAENFTCARGTVFAKRRYRLCRGEEQSSCGSALSAQ